MTPVDKTLLINQIDALLPQTQCGLCGYQGCLPYATALANQQATVDLCPPGGTDTLLQLATLLEQDATPYLNAMAAKTKPPSMAIIREAECIGCTKCIQACPVDAIIGAGKVMHTVISDHCTGCELCIAPCPVDCIDMRAVIRADSEKPQRAHQARQRFNARKQRLDTQYTHQTDRHQTAKLQTADPALTQLARKAEIAAAVARAKAKKHTLSSP